MTDLEIIKILLEELEGQNTRLRGGRGYSAGSPWWDKKEPKQMLGKSFVDEYFPEDEDEESEDEEFKPIEISKAFKK
jgi:hypothetical protein|tara:strand:+ start:385 stop:615 length:231 start_codon:yes stop_codon:yes gene_type:complete